MGYILQEPQTFINIKLTNLGRRQLALGQLNFSTYAFSDREVNYSIDRTDSYSVMNNRILSPVDAQPNLTQNFDGTAPQPLLSKFVSTAKQFSTAHTETYGFFSGVTTGYTNYYIDSTKILGADRLDYSANTDGGSVITLAGLGDTPTVGNFVRIGWSSSYYNQNLAYTGTITEYSGAPLNYLFYRIVSGGSVTNTYLLDRDIPDFNSVYGQSAKTTNAIFYPSQTVENFYGSGATVDPKLWNFNVVRTESTPGTTSGISGYTSYGSIEYNGTKQYLGFSADTPIFGILHYSNAYTGNTYAEQLIEGSVTVEIPYLMWWNTPGDNGNVMTQGLVLYDGGSDSTLTDTAAGTTYRNLKDSLATNALVVGRVYHKLKIIVITDQELLTALSYKANRNWTLPDFKLNLISNPKFPLTSSEATGMCSSGYSYYVTYLVNSTGFTENVSYGFGNGLHCGYIQKIDGQNDSFGNPQFLSLSFPTNSFPFLRSSSSMSGASSGTGWNANYVQVLVNKQFSGYSYQVGDAPADGWVAVSNIIGNGIYTGETTDLSINPLKLAGYNFIMSDEDLLSGTTYILDRTFSGETDFVSTTGLTFGNESFFYGNVNADILATTYKTLITAVASNNDYNDSLNNSYDPIVDNDTYITEVDVFDSSNNLVATGKPSYPIKKNDGRYIVIQLEMDF